MKYTKKSIIYVMAISFVAAIGGLLLGFDASVISGAIEPMSHHYHLTPSQMGWAVSNIIFGSIIGCLISGYVGDKFGRKKALIITAVAFSLSVLGTALSTSFPMFVIFRIIGGISMGMASVISPIYIAEVAPKEFRGTAITMQSICITGGQIIVLLTNYLIAHEMSMQWLESVGWRWMLGSVFAPCALFLIFSIFIPETPRWNILAGFENKALKTLRRISQDEQHALAIASEIKESLKTHINVPKQHFKLTKRSAVFLFIGVGLALFNQFTGINVIQYYGPSLLMNITDSLQNAMYMTIFLALCQFIGVLVGMWLIDRVGRTALLKLGSIMCFACLLYTFFAFYFGVKGYACIIGLFGFMVFNGITWGQVVWTVIGEIFPTRMRAAGTGISMSGMYVGNFIISQTFPLMNTNHYLVDTFHGGFPLLLFAGLTLISWVFVKLYVPETKGLSLEEMEHEVLTRFHIDDEAAAEQELDNHLHPSK
ncbi:sugar porter family MFS transporter [Celerinatantimonas sp. MCCC 1A17872]|uniref:sugar porter family MFS transporter n=1 Tax=Celerinatantimonas sp. MCCC 1A17872 TaxID=3177514 RepID=UPI0038C3AAEE